MTDERNKDGRELESLVRELSSDAAPSVDFAKTLRASFSSGSIEPGSFRDETNAGAVEDLDDDLTCVWLEAETEESASSDSEDTRTRSSEAHSGRLLAFPVWSQALVLAAAVALIFLVRSANEGAGPEQITAAGNGTIEIDGQTFALSELPAFRDLLEPGAAIHVEGDMSALLDLVYPGFMAVQITAGVEMTLPKPAGRWFNRTASFGVGQGEVRVVTGPDFAGADLAILAPGTEIEITGTTFAVICSPCSTCVCVLEGTAQMTDESGRTWPVAPGHRQTFFNDRDDPPLDEPIRGEERMKLEMLREASQARLGVEQER